MKKSLIAFSTLFSIANANLDLNKSNVENNSTLAQETQQIIKDKKLDYLFLNSKFPTDEYIFKAGFRKPIEKVLTYNKEELRKITKEQWDKMTDEEKKAYLQSLSPEERAKFLATLNKEEREKFLNSLSEEERNQILNLLDPKLKEEYLKSVQDKEKKQKELEQKLKENQAKIEKEAEEERRKQELERQKQRQRTSANNQAYTNKRRIENLLRDSLLANRTSEIKDFKSTDRYGVDGFSNQQSIDISTNEHKLSRMIRAGRMIPALLTTAISSDISGLVTAQIEQDIFAAHGRAVLIPRGSKAIGFYTNTTQIGQNRIEIQWREIITPQGVNILLTNAFVADNMGMTGANGAVNNKYWERYALPIGISTISNTLLLGIASKMNNTGNGNNNSINVNDYQQEVFQGFQTDINEVVKDIIQQHKNIQPTIEIKSGSRIFLVPNHHLWFSKPKNNEVLAKYFQD